MKKFAFLVHPHFIIRYYLYKDIKSIVKKYHFKNSILDVGCGVKPYRKLFKDSPSYLGIDFKSYSRNKGYKGDVPDFYFDSNYSKTLKLPFPDKSFNNVVSFQVLEHHKDPLKFVSEIARVTKKGGLILISAPFIWSIHEEPNDFIRITEYFLKEIFNLKNCQIIVIKKQGSIPSVISSLSTDFLIEFANKSKFRYLLGFSIYPLFQLFSYACLFLDQIFKSDKIFLNYLVLAQKK